MKRCKLATHLKHNTSLAFRSELKKKRSCDLTSRFAKSGKTQKERIFFFALYLKNKKPPHLRSLKKKRCGSKHRFSLFHASTEGSSLPPGMTKARFLSVFFLFSIPMREIFKSNLILFLLLLSFHFLFHTRAVFLRCWLSEAGVQRSTRSTRISCKMCTKRREKEGKRNSSESAAGDPAAITLKNPSDMHHSDVNDNESSSNKDHRVVITN